MGVGRGGNVLQDPLSQLVKQILNHLKKKKKKKKSKFFRVRFIVHYYVVCSLWQ